MTAFLGWVAVVLLVGAVAPCLVAVCRGTVGERAVALQGLSVVSVVLLAVVALAEERPSYLDVSLLLALVTFAGSMVFARFFGRLL